MWTVDYTYVTEWLASLDPETRDCVTAAVEVLMEFGPALGRPLVDTVTASRHKNMKELRPPSPGMSEFRILFAFDPRRKAILLLGGDESGMVERKKSRRDKWGEWYKKAIPIADERYDEHLRWLSEKGKKDG